MDLDAYRQKMQRQHGARFDEEWRKFAKRANTSTMYLSHIIKSHKYPGWSKLMDIHKASDGDVRLEDQRPELFKRGAEGARLRAYFMAQVQSEDRAA